MFAGNSDVALKAILASCIASSEEDVEAHGL
jgi:hypothetical protein